MSIIGLQGVKPGEANAGGMQQSSEWLGQRLINLLSIRELQSSFNCDEIITKK